MGIGGRQCVINKRNLYNFLKKNKNFIVAEIMGKKGRLAEQDC